MKITPVRTGLFTAQADLASFIVRHIPSVAEGTVVAVASKLICLWKGKIEPYESEEQKEKLIRQESDFALKTPLCWLTVKDGMVMTNAGIDESNADGKLLFFPPDMYALAADLRTQLIRQWHVKNLGIVITDSMILPLRAGVIAGAVAYAGFKGVKDMRGKKDLFGRKLKVTLIDVADSLSTAAALCMGEGNEQTPLALIEQAPAEFVDEVPPNEIKYSVENDLYTPLFKAVGYHKQGEKND
ncbi:coenzyme F420-0:L-glutamate ligase [Candidatus Avelusimicrobium luingense]|uniref:coenzyme F420-0:L-glutamate ligase n=1 Tax=Candidatus Avelusimicrobium luingense TaxID=3416211 RepID=UPI003D0CD072